MTMYLGVMKSMRAAVKTDPDSIFRKSVNIEVYFWLSEVHGEEKNKNVHNKNRKWPYLTCRVTLIGITKCLIVLHLCISALIIHVM